MEELREEIRAAFEQNSTAELEVKMIDRMNDVVKALTKSMADRNDTRKNFRVLEKQVKNLFEIVMFQATSNASGSPH